MSQQYSFRKFRKCCPDGIVTYSHPEMREYLLGFGYPEKNLIYVANGSDTTTADRVPDQPKLYDLVWMGRVHPQKGVDDLLSTLAVVEATMPDFRAMIIEKVAKPWNQWCDRWDWLIT